MLTGLIRFNACGRVRVTGCFGLDVLVNDMYLATRRRDSHRLSQALVQQPINGMLVLYEEIYKGFFSVHFSLGFGGHADGSII